MKTTSLPEGKHEFSCSDNNYTNDWVITSTEMSSDYQVDENIAYIYN